MERREGVVSTLSARTRAAGRGPRSFVTDDIMVAGSLAGEGGRGRWDEDVFRGQEGPNRISDPRPLASVTRGLWAEGRWQGRARPWEA
jgi:hypothetical protein